jgi:putative tricarboxylic transport membrane protein
MVLGDKTEDAFRQSMILSRGSLAIFWSNPLVASLMTLAIVLAAWPALAAARRLFAAPARTPTSSAS